MTRLTTNELHINRRRLLSGAGKMALSIPVLGLSSCQLPDSLTTETETDTTDSTSSDSDNSGTTSGSSDTLSFDDSPDWLTGGTSSMSGSSYPDVFTELTDSICSLTCETTEGPCYAATLERMDISEGHDGLPMRLAFRVVDDTCTPVPGAVVDIWHCNYDGLYSGDDSIAFCNGNDNAAISSRWFRGTQTTDEDGRVDFNSCFPGWYSSRTVHIHCIIQINDETYVTTQFCFDDSLCDDIINTQPGYSDRGERDTTNTKDTVYSAENYSNFVFSAGKVSDGSLMAWKTLMIRTSLEDAMCTISTDTNSGTEPGAGGSGMGGMEPPEGGEPPEMSSI